MPLEAVMIVVDNSESSRNGDYTPTRFEAQADAVHIIFQHIINGNPESSVGLMSMAGKGPEVLVTLTADTGKILEGLHRTKAKIRGEAHLATSIQIASVREALPLRGALWPPVAPSHTWLTGETHSWPSSTGRTRRSGPA